MFSSYHAEIPLSRSESKHGSGLAEAVSRLIPVLVLVAPSY